jgi:hypothetical protein
MRWGLGHTATARAGGPPVTNIRIAALARVVAVEQS